jgi:peptide/nickel transport system substrate-binding protein
MTRHLAPHRLTFVAVALLTLVSSCAPGPSPSSAPAAGSGGSAPASAPSPKVLTIGLQRELESFSSFSTGGGGIAAPDIAHDSLVTRTPNGEWVASLAVEKPSVEKGTWQINADGSMDVTWKIHPNVKWHDGTPFTSADLAFTRTVYGDKDLPSSLVSQLDRVQSVSTPDPYTFVAHYSRLEVRADQAGGFATPLARHLLESQYLSNKTELPGSPHITNQFVGLGPYRLVRWDSGIQMEFARFDDYYRGRPPLDRVILRYVRDPNAMIATILAGDVDVIIPPGPDVDAGMQVRQRWTGTDHQVIIAPTDEFNWMQIQFRPEVLRTASAWTNRDVRQALSHAIDRQTLSQVMTHGLSATADSWFPPNHPLRAQVQDAIPQFPFDLNRAQALLTQAGWTKGADGILVNAAGERFEVDLWANERLDLQREQAIVAEQWKGLGVQASIQVVSAVMSQDRRNEVLLSGPRIGSVRIDRFLYDNQLHSRETANEANRWGGRNRGAYGNPEGDAILDRLGNTIDVRDRTPLYRESLRIHLGDVAIMPMYWEIEPVMHLGSVKGITHAGQQTTFNFHEWNKQ